MTSPSAHAAPSNGWYLAEGYYPSRMARSHKSSTSAGLSSPARKKRTRDVYAPNPSIEAKFGPVSFEAFREEIRSIFRPVNQRASSLVDDLAHIEWQVRMLSQFHDIQVAMMVERTGSQGEVEFYLSNPQHPATRIEAIICSLNRDIRYVQKAIEKYNRPTARTR